MGNTCCFTGHRPQNLPFGFNEEEDVCKKGINIWLTIPII